MAQLDFGPAQLAPGGPLSWPLWWRICMYGSLCWFVMMGQFLSASLPPMMGSLIQTFHTDSNETAQLASWATLAIGLGNVWAVPSVAYIGSRYTILLGLIIFTACFFWQAAAQSHRSLLAARIVGGLGGGIVESLGPVMVVILFPQEVIGRAMSAYTFALGAGTVFGPLIAGYMVQDLGSWRYPLYLFGGISALNLFGFVIMFPEPIMNIRVPGDPVMTISEPGSGAEVTDEAKHRSGDSSAGQAECYEGSSPAPSNISASRYALWRRRSFFFKISHQHPVASLWALAVVPYRILAVPAVLLTVLTFGVTISSTIAASILVSMLFSQPPMLWTPAQIGLFNIAPLIGLLTGMVIGGPFADWLSARHYRRHGQFKPEVILPILAPLAIILPIAVTLVGVGFERHWHWAVIGFLWAIINMNLTGGCTVLISYATDIHPRKAIDIGVVVNVFKNAIGAGISFATTEWWFKDQWLMFLTLGMILFVLLLLTAPLYFWGPKIARKTESWLEGYNVD